MHVVDEIGCMLHVDDLNDDLVELWLNMLAALFLHSGPPPTVWGIT